ncbi:unnamed protein product [Ceratitis capitata]|uniref:(Mediterranean fruit fly) hypothetical protein n=1 Tax=Ceratitis capitata TaxID=7213 RepID=A0A811UET4_CERCA|nr:unnamed protein product [Ceratitis capitata]
MLTITYSPGIYKCNQSFAQTDNNIQIINFNLACAFKTKKRKKKKNEPKPGNTFFRLIISCFSTASTCIQHNLLVFLVDSLIGFLDGLLGNSPPTLTTINFIFV